jgi:hypothetical protein
MNRAFLKENPKLTNYYIFSVFAYLSAVFCIALSVLTAATPDFFPNVYGLQESLIYGKYIDGFIPLILISSVYSVCTRELDLRAILSAVVVSGGIFTAFFSLTAPYVVRAGQVNVSAILGIYPLRIGADIDSLITVDGLFLTLSAVFCFMALLIVYVCCGGKHRVKIISATIAGIAVYSGVYVCSVYLPYERSRVIGYNTPVYEVSEHIFNSADAHPVIVSDNREETVALLQFLNGYAQSSGVNDNEYENYFFIDLKTGFLPLEQNENTVIIGETDSYRVYAVGEKAVMYAGSVE